MHLLAKEGLAFALPDADMRHLGGILQRKGYKVFMQAGSLYAFKGLAGKFAPIGVHAAMLLVMAGATAGWASIGMPGHFVAILYTLSQFQPVSAVLPMCQHRPQQLHMTVRHPCQSRSDSILVHSGVCPCRGVLWRVGGIQRDSHAARGR